MDEGKRKKKKKKHRHSKMSEKPELKVTTRGQGADTPVWTHAGSAKDSSSSSDSQSKGDSGLGSNPSNLSHRGTDTEPRRGIPLRSSPDATREPTVVIKDAPLSDWGEGDEDQEMPDTNEQGDNDAGPEPEPVFVPNEVPEQVQLGGDPAGAGDDGEPQEPQEPPGAPGASPGFSSRFPDRIPDPVGGLWGCQLRNTEDRPEGPEGIHC